MNIKKIFNIFEISALAVFILTLSSNYTKFVPNSALWNSIIVFIMMIINIHYFIFAMFSFVKNLMSTSRNKQDGFSAIRTILIIFHFLAGSIIVCGSVFLLRHYPGGTSMAALGFITLFIILALFQLLTLIKRNTIPPFAIKLGKELIVIKNREIIIRCLILLCIGFFSHYLSHKYLSYTSENNFIFQLDDYEPYSENDKKIATIWYYIDRGYDSNAIMRVYDIDETEYAKQVNKIVFNNIGNVSTDYKVTINQAVVDSTIKTITNYSLTGFPTNVKQFVAPEDTLNLDKQMPVFSECYDPYSKNYYYLELIDRHSNNQTIKELLNNFNEIRNEMNLGNVNYY